MIDLQNAQKKFKLFLNQYQDQNKLGFNLKVVHTYHVVENAKLIATKLKLSQEDIELAQLIALLHDIGRFDELQSLNKFDNINFDHATYGLKILFHDNLIREFIKETKYDEIIKAAIKNHSRLKIEDNLEPKALLHAKIIRDADKLDNFRVKKEEPIETIFPNILKNISELENSTISPKIYKSIINNQCVNLHHQKTALDYWVCILAFTFDLNFKETLLIVKKENYINSLIDRINYTNSTTKKQMETIRQIINQYIDNKIKNTL